MSRKTTSFSQLLEYISRSDAKTFEPILHNLISSGIDVKEIEIEFKNNSHYCSERINGVILYHEVLAFSGKDRQHIDANVINDLAQKYLELRASGALAYGVIHYDHENPHVHLMISGNLLESSKKLRMSKKEFHSVKKELERYQRKRYPQLENSVVLHKQSRDKSKKTRKEQERNRRIGPEKKHLLSQKEAVKEKMVYCFLAHSQAEFSNRLQVCELELYVRGKAVGVIDQNSGRKYRLKTIGLLEQYLETSKQWGRGEGRKMDLWKLELAKIQRLWKSFGFKERILKTLFPSQGNGREKELEEISVKKRRISSGEDLGIQLHF